MSTNLDCITSIYLPEAIEYARQRMLLVAAAGEHVSHAPHVWHCSSEEWDSRDDTKQEQSWDAPLRKGGVSGLGQKPNRKSMRIKAVRRNGRVRNSKRWWGMRRIVCIKIRLKQHLKSLRVPLSPHPPLHHPHLVSQNPVLWRGCYQFCLDTLLSAFSVHSLSAAVMSRRCRVRSAPEPEKTKMIRNIQAAINTKPFCTKKWQRYMDHKFSDQISWVHGYYELAIVKN